MPDFLTTVMPTVEPSSKLDSNHNHFKGGSVESLVTFERLLTNIHLDFLLALSISTHFSESGDLDGEVSTLAFKAPEKSPVRSYFLNLTLISPLVLIDSTIATVYSLYHLYS